MGFEEQIAKQIADLEGKTGRKLSEDAKNVLRQQEMAKLVKNSNGVQSTADMPAPANVKTDKVGLGAAAAARGNAGAGAGAGGSGRAGLGAVSSLRGGKYDTDMPEAQTIDQRMEDVDTITKRLGARNAELLAPLEKYQLKYEEEADKAKKNALSDALIAGGLGALSGTSPFAGANIGQGGLKGLDAWQSAQKSHQAAQDKMLQAQADMAKSKIALKKGDEAAAIQFANQGRQDMKDRAMLNLQAQHFYNQDVASQMQAQAYLNRAAAAGGGNDDKHMAALARVKGVLNQDPEYKELAKMAAFKGTIGDNARARMAAMEKQHYQMLAPELLRMAGGNTMPTSPAGGGGGAKFLGFE
jgi:hypothetical protein